MDEALRADPQAPADVTAKQGVEKMAKDTPKLFEVTPEQAKNFAAGKFDETGNSAAIAAAEREFFKSTPPLPSTKDGTLGAGYSREFGTRIVTAYLAVVRKHTDEKPK